MLYMNEDKSKRTEDKEQDDLFGYHDLTSDPEPEADALADVEPSREPEEQNLTPETLPLIQEEKPPQKPVQIEQKTKKAPLIFSAHAPIPTRGGLREEDDSRRKRIREQTSREIPPLTLEQIPEDYSLGKILTLARENAAYSIDAVADITRISSNFILSFENDDLKRLPPFIYQTAYLREMCKLYKLPQETGDFLLQLHRSLQTDVLTVPQDDLLGKQPQDDHRANLLFTGSIIAIGIVIVLAIWAVIIALVKHNGEEEAYQQQIADAPAVQPISTPVDFDQKKLEKLMPEPVRDIRLLKMDKSGKASD
ncbi:MAG: helix-turn-helix domain-containing protein [Lentisphaeria bacterium]|nr:helix-turn-helix domain-containing protein [Lentisphaeria bacterium]